MLQYYEVPFDNSLCYSTSQLFNSGIFPLCPYVPGSSHFLLCKSQCIWFYVDVLIHLDLNFVSGGKNLHSSTCLLPVEPAPFVENAVFLPQNGLATLSRTSDHTCVSSFLGFQFYFIYLPAFHCTSTMQFLSQLLCSSA